MAKRKRKLTTADKAHKKRLREMYKTVFINGKQKRIRREPTVEGLPVEEFIRRNADPIWLRQSEMWELIDQEDEQKEENMAYYPKDAAAVQRLREQIEALGVPLILMRKFIQLIGAITVQVEDEYTSRGVIATVFTALVQQAEEIRKPESERIKELIEVCRLDIEKRLDKREARTRGDRTC